MSKRYLNIRSDDSRNVERQPIDTLHDYVPSHLSHRHAPSRVFSPLSRPHPTRYNTHIRLDLSHLLPPCSLATSPPSRLHSTGTTHVWLDLPLLEGNSEVISYGFFVSSSTPSRLSSPPPDLIQRGRHHVRLHPSRF